MKAVADHLAWADSTIDANEHPWKLAGFQVWQEELLAMLQEVVAGVTRGILGTAGGEGVPGAGRLPA